MKGLAVKQNQDEVVFENVKITAADITKYLCPKATEKEIYMALNIIASYKLNPFKREVHIIKYGDQPAQVVVGYEVYLKRAERTGKWNGMEVVSDDDTATCTVYRKDWDKPLVWTISKKEFNKNQASWTQMPDFMLRKVAIAQAFRLAFPDELGGLPYLKEEVDTFYTDTKAPGKPVVAQPKSLPGPAAALQEAPGQPEVGKVEPAPAQESPTQPGQDVAPELEGVAFKPGEYKAIRPISPPQANRLYAVSKAAGWTEADMKALLFRNYGIDSGKLLDRENNDYDDVIDWIQSHPRKAPGK